MPHCQSAETFSRTSAVEYLFGLKAYDGVSPVAVDGLDADLFDAVEFGDREYAELLLDAPDVNIDAQDLAGTTILMLASSYGHVELLQIILGRGADPNLQDKQGRTALQRAIESGHLGVVELLKQAGAV
ncbi:ankyrin repeat domain-containing protein [Planctopirus hydrillae]|uniref:ankyrin repeat domain-containing protein n=1 Tax=Planctopirus hydrillae TaxID=1841610 RepID=UPI0009F6E65B|nr:ankyrin repeat domain-containing protein [Planctopirus hydrillae]